MELGRSDVRVSAIGVGTWQWGSRSWGYGREYGREDLREAFEKALELGVNFFDTAEIYGGGWSERLLGEFMKERREEVVVATKLWPSRITRGMMWKALNRSLERLGTSYVDLYQLHWPNPLVPVSRYMRVMEEMWMEGKIRAIGVSNLSLRQLEEARAALSHTDVASNQVKFNMLERDVERELLPYCQKEKITLIAYSPLAQGLLTGKYGPGRRPRDMVRRINRLFTPEYLRSVKPLLMVLGEIAERREKTMAQVALNWLISKPWVTAIPGAKHGRHVEEAAGAMGWRLDGEELGKIDEALRLVKPNKAKVLLQSIALLLKP